MDLQHWMRKAKQAEAQIHAVVSGTKSARTEETKRLREMQVSHYPRRAGQIRNHSRAADPCSI